jgi:5'-nucleotidase
MQHRLRFIAPVAFLSTLMLAAILAAVAPPAQAKASASPPAAAATGAPFSLTLLHTNDIHAHVDQYQNSGAWCPITGAGCIAGIARLKTAIDQVRSVVSDALVLDAGDQFQGTLYYNVYKSDVLTRAVNVLGYHAMAVGNHEFDDGPAELRRFVDGVNFPVLAANLDVSAEPRLASRIKPSTVVTVGGMPIGIIGLTTEDLPALSNPGGAVRVTPVLAAAQAEANRLQGQGVRIIVALTHIGYDVDLALGRAVTGVDVIVGGHSHSFLHTPVTVTNGDAPVGPYPTVVTAPDGEPVAVVSAFQWGRYLGRLDLTFSPTGALASYSGQPIYLENAIPPNPAAQAVISPTYNVPLEALRHTIIGTATTPMSLTVGGALVCREGECQLGNFLAEASLWKVNASLPVTRHYQIALHNAGMLRAPIAEGPVSLGAVMELLPYGNSLATFELTGTHLITALESGLSRYQLSGSGRFPQAAGLRYVWDPRQPAGARLWRVEARNALGQYEPISPTAVYRIVSNNYARGGGDGYSIFQSGLNAYDFGPAIDQTAVDYLKAFSPYTPFLDGRISQPRRWALPIVGRTDP